MAATHIRFPNQKPHIRKEHGSYIVRSQAKTTFYFNGLHLHSGRAYYECTLVKKMTLKRKNFAPLFLGWIDAEYKNLRFGDDLSYSEESSFHRWRIRFEDISTKKRSSRPLIGKIGDVIGCGIDFDRKTIVFSLNGSFPHRFGVRHRNIQFKEWITPSMVVHGCTVSVNFGDAPFQFPMSGYPSVTDRVVEQKEAENRFVCFSSSFPNRFDHRNVDDVTLKEMGMCDGESEMTASLSHSHDKVRWKWRRESERESL